MKATTADKGHKRVRQKYKTTVYGKASEHLQRRICETN